MKKKILCLSGSPRERGNSHTLVERFAEGAREAGAAVEVVRPHALRIEACRGCLRCNVLGRCAIKGDDWPGVAEAFKAAGGVLFASPVYFHHVTGPLKLLLDRFRSLLHVKMVHGGIGLEHEPRYDPRKAWGLILVQGARGEHGVREVRDLVAFVAGIGCEDPFLDVLVGNGLGLSGQVRMDAEALAILYRKVGLPPERAPADAAYNEELRDRAHAMGRRMAERIGV